MPIRNMDPGAAGVDLPSKPALETRKSVIATGNFVDGIEFTGPFDDPGDALDYAEKHDIREWSLVFLQAPATDTVAIHAGEAVDQ